MFNTTGLLGSEATISNTSLGYVTNLTSKVHEFHVGINTTFNLYNDANSLATNHTTWSSNTSRLPSLEEAIALYAANFGGNTGNKTNTTQVNTVGGMQAITDISASNGYSVTEDNRPGNWTQDMFWTSSPSPSGQNIINLSYGDVRETFLGTAAKAYTIVVL